METMRASPIFNNELSLNDILNGWTIKIDKLPNYDEFKKPFVIKWNKTLSEEIINGEYDVLTPEVITNYTNNIHNRINDMEELIIFHNNRYGLGRFYSNCDSSPVAHSKYIKHTIFKSLNFVDVDMVKGHPSILRYICKLNNIPTKVFDEVVFNFDKICDDVIMYYKNLCNVELNKDNVKFYFNLTIYGGSYNTWLLELRNLKKAEKYGYAIKFIPDEIPIHPVFASYKKACVGIMNFVYINNPIIESSVCGNLIDENEKKRRVMSYYCGVIENHIVYFVYNKLIEMGGIKPQNCLLELDGLCIPKTNDIDYYEITENINKLLEPYEIRFKIKEYGEYVLCETINENAIQNKIDLDNNSMDKNENEVEPEQETLNENLVEPEQEALNEIATIIEGLENKRKLTTIAKKQKKLNDEDVDDEDKTLTDLDLQLIQLKQQLKLKKSQEKKEQLLKKEQDKLKKEQDKLEREKTRKKNESIKEMIRLDKEQNKREKQEYIERQKEITRIEKLNKETEKQRIKDEKIRKNTEKYRFVSDDESASLLIFEELKDILIPDKKGRLFLKVDNVWICDFEPIQNFILNHITMSNISRENDKKEYIPYAKNVKTAKNIRELVIVKIKTQKDIPDIYDKFHTTTKNRLCFKDGVLDMKQQKFYTWEEVDFEYYSTIMINYEYGDYYKNPDRKTIIDVRNAIFKNLFGGDIELALQFFARGIAGRCDDKNWASYLGNRDCGKGVLFAILKIAFGDYIKAFELGNILIDKTTKIEEISRKMYWLLDYEFVRLGISQETPKDDNDKNKTNLKINGTIGKKMMGGDDTQIAKRNYDTHDTEFKLDTTFLFMGNGELEVSDKDMNEHRISFNSAIQYKTQEEIDIMRKEGKSEMFLSSYLIKDPEIKEKVKSIEWAKACVYLICENFKNSAILIKKENIEEEDLSLREKIVNNFEITQNTDNIIESSIIYEFLNDFGSKKINNELNSLGVNRKKNRCRGDMYNKMCFYGIKFSNDEEIEIEDNGVLGTASTASNF